MKQYITKEILLGIIKTGVLFGVAVIAPGVLKVVKNLQEKDTWFEYYPSTVNRTLNKLYRQGIVEVKKIKGNEVVFITKQGEVEILKYDLEKLTIQPQKRWDKKWRLVVFDIAEKYKKIREIVRYKLQEIGFYKFQESVFIYPYPCEKEISFMREVLHVPHSIKLIRADRIENDKQLRQIFNLL